MKRLLLSISTCALLVNAEAQISLTSSMVKPGGTVYYNYDANVPFPAFTFAKTGINNTWDFTGLYANPADQDTIYYVNPTVNNGGSNFPDAQLGIYEVGDDGITFVKYDANAAYALGIAGDIIGNGQLLSIAFEQPALAFSFPYTLGSTVHSSTTANLKFTGSQVGYSSVDSVSIFNKSIISKEVIASGYMILPSGNYPCLLEVKREKSIDSTLVKDDIVTSNQWQLAPGFPKVKTDSTYYWYTAESLEPYAHVIYKNGVITDVTYFKSVSTLVGLKKNVVPSVVSVYPNPAKDVIKLSSANTIKQIVISTINGEQVMSTSTVTNELPIHSLAAGIYVVSITNTDNTQEHIKFVKQ